MFHPWYVRHTPPQAIVQAKHASQEGLLCRRSNFIIVSRRCSDCECKENMKGPLSGNNMRRCLLYMRYVSSTTLECLPKGYPKVAATEPARICDGSAVLVFCLHAFSAKTGS